MTLTFVLFLAFVVNTGMLVNAKINLQNAADLAAYAGAATQARPADDDFVPELRDAPASTRKFCCSATTSWAAARYGSVPTPKAPRKAARFWGPQSRARHPWRNRLCRSRRLREPRGVSRAKITARPVPFKAIAIPSSNPLDQINRPLPPAARPTRKSAPAKLQDDR